MSTIVHAYVGLGSNLENPAGQITRALEELDDIPETVCVGHSQLYRSAPLGPVAQSHFINAVAVLHTSLSAQALLACLHEMERRHGRMRNGQKWGPRTLDMDLLLYGDTVLRDFTLEVPHPGLAQRNFVLYPLYELAPGLEIPGQGSLRGLLARCPYEGLEPLACEGSAAIGEAPAAEPK